MGSAAQDRWDLLVKLSTARAQERKNLLKIKRLISKDKVIEAAEFIDQCLEKAKPARCISRQGQSTLQGTALKERPTFDPIISKIMDNY